MAITKKDLLDLQKNIFLETSKFLEKNVIEPLFDIKKDIKALKHDVEQIDRKLDKTIDRLDRHGEKITALESSTTN